jgi:hypothetical protein
MSDLLLGRDIIACMQCQAEDRDILGGYPLFASEAAPVQSLCSGFALEDALVHVSVSDIPLVASRPDLEDASAQVMVSGPVVTFSKHFLLLLVSHWRILGSHLRLYLFPL